jgi:hypothetical protein
VCQNDRSALLDVIKARVVLQHMERDKMALGQVSFKKFTTSKMPSLHARRSSSVSTNTVILLYYNNNQKIAAFWHIHETMCDVLDAC